MRALLYDIHGNLPALEAVIADARAAGADEFVLGGDYALAGPGRRRASSGSRSSTRRTGSAGNTERWLEEPSDAPDDELLHRLIEYCRGELGGQRIEQLFELPPSLSLRRRRCVCHASPHDDMLTFMPEPTGGGPRAARQHATKRSSSSATATSSSSARPRAAGCWSTPGSVGLPFDGDRRAAYALWRGGREFELRRVEYDSDGYAAQVRERMGEALGARFETLVRRIQQAAFVQ